MALPPGWSVCGGRFVDELLSRSQSVRPLADSKSWSLQSDHGRAFWQCEDSSTGGSFWIDDPFPWQKVVNFHGQTLWHQTISDLRFLEEDQKCDVQPTMLFSKFQQAGPSTSASTAMINSHNQYDTDGPRVTSCFRFQHGECLRGDRCRHEHVIVFCHRFHRGICDRGNQCHFSHDTDTRASRYSSHQAVVDPEVLQAPDTSTIRPSHPQFGSSSSVSLTMINSCNQHNNAEPRLKICFRFQHGDCQRGDGCRHEHVIVFCHRFQRRNCHRGNACHFSHDVDTRASSHSCPQSVVESAVSQSVVEPEVLDWHDSWRSWPGWITYADSSSWWGLWLWRFHVLLVAATFQLCTLIFIVCCTELLLVICCVEQSEAISAYWSLQDKDFRLYSNVFR